MATVIITITDNGDGINRRIVHSNEDSQELTRANILGCTVYEMLVPLNETISASIRDEFRDGAK